MGQKENDGTDKKLRNPQAFRSWRATESQQPWTKAVVKDQASGASTGGMD